MLVIVWLVMTRLLAMYAGDNRVGTVHAGDNRGGWLSSVCCPLSDRFHPSLLVCQRQ